MMKFFDKLSFSRGRSLSAVSLPLRGCARRRVSERNRRRRLLARRLKVAEAPPEAG